MFSFLSPFKLYIAVGTIILISAIVGLHLWGDKREHSARLAAESALTAYKLQQTIIVNAAIIENAKKLEQANLKVKQAVKNSDENLAKFNLANVDRNQLTQKARVLNAKIDQYEVISERTRSNLNDSLRLSASRDGLAASKESSAGQRLSTCDSDITTLRYACRLTTIDLVKAYTIIEADTLACGREK